MNRKSLLKLNPRINRCSACGSGYGAREYAPMAVRWSCGIDDFTGPCFRCREGEFRNFIANKYTPSQVIKLIEMYIYRNR